MKRLLCCMFLFVPVLLSAETTVKMKDFSYIDGLKENQLIGYGLVVGLAGTGDSRIALTESSLKNLLKNIGMSDSEILRTKNAAAVLVTAKLPPVTRVGDRIDVNVSSIGNAKSLEGGVLLQAALKGPDDQIYAVAQGPLSFKEQMPGRRTRIVKTGATVPLGGIVERGIDSELIKNDSITFVLTELDFSVLDELSKAVSDQYPDANPQIGQNGKITFSIPKDIPSSEFIAAIEEMEVTPKYKARVVVNEKDGTIVMGTDVKISEVVISKDNLTVKIEGQNEKVTAAVLKEASSVKDLVDALNYINASSSELISILKALKDAGALHAELIIK